MVAKAEIFSFLATIKINGMRKIHIFSIALLLSFLSQVHAQTGIAFIQRIYSKNVMLIGVTHDANKTRDLCSKITKINFDRLFPTIREIVGDRPLMIVSESIKSLLPIEIGDPLVPSLVQTFPSSLKGIRVFGMDERNPWEVDSIANLLFDTYMRRYYQDTCLKNLVSFEASCLIDCPLPKDKLPTRDTAIIRKLSVRFTSINTEFENGLVSWAKFFEEKGYYVIVLCGSTHTARLQQKYDFDYIILGETDPRDIILSVHKYKVAEEFAK
jgi:hypothetical protein